LICGPLFGIGTIVFNQSQGIYHEIISGDKVVPLINKVNDYVNNWLPDGFSFDFNQKLSDFFSFISDNVARIFSTTLATIFSFLLMLLTIFYFLKDGQEWKKSLITLSPMPDADDRRIIARLKETINSVMKGYLLIALLQGILMGVGLFIFGVPNPALWGVVAAITSLIPTAGTALVSVPAIIFLFITGHIPQAIGMLAWAALFVGLIDNLLSPMLISKRIKIPEFIILFSVLGGIVLLGPVGILIGPLSVSLLYTLVSMYRKEFSPNPIPK
jgi:predicted PurR-regulated permease PerM